MTGLPDHAVRDRIAGDGDGLGDTLFVEAGAGSGKTRSLVERVLALVGSGVQMRHIAAITFTEKAAAELRDRIHRALEQRFAASRGGQEAGCWRAALEQVDGAAISTLHAFAQRILSEHPVEAGLPPNLEVLDEVASEIAFEERWVRFRERLLDDPELSRTLLLGFSAGLQLSHLRDLAVAFGQNWDLVAERVDWPASDPPALDLEDLLDGLDQVAAAAASCGVSGDKLLAKLQPIVAYADRLRAAPDEYEQLRLLGETQPSFKPGKAGRPGNWPCDLGALRDRVRRLGALRADCRHRVACASLHRLALVLRDFTLDAAVERRSSGTLEFHDLLVLARALLRGAAGPRVREALRSRYRRLLLDEFQDTDPIQIELAVLLASPDPAAGNKHWGEIAVEPGRLFFVGDPKQSIYRFRRADIGVFLRAREAFGTAPLQLTTNFRTSGPVIEWINHVFGRLIVGADGSQPSYIPLAPAPGRAAAPVGPAVTLLGRRAHPEPRLTADELREREAAEVAATVAAAIADEWSVRDGVDSHGDECWRSATLGDVTILLPSRTSLATLERALDERGIAYRAETSSLVYSTREVRDLFAALRAVADPGDQLSIVTALRSAVFGCGDDDLLTYRQAGGSWNYRAPAPAGLARAHPVCEAMRWLAELHREHVWLTPSELLDRIARERRLFELGFAQDRPRDLWRRLRFVLDQSREWSEAAGGTLREYLAWARLQASDSVRVAETVLPETDDDAVRIMTVHAAKGLEFPIVVVSGLTTALRGRRPGVQVVWPPHGRPGIKVGSGLKTAEFEAFEPIDEQMDADERRRLLYVACTRAKDHLVVSLHRKPPSDTRQPTNAEVLADACEDAPHAEEFVPVGRQTPVLLPPPPPAAAELGDLPTWQRERDRLVRAGTRPRTLAATGVAGLALGEAAPDVADRLAGLADDGAAPKLAPEAAGGCAGDAAPDPATAAGRISSAPAADPGMRKEPRDLDLAPWLKGRYGTAVGRAVHAVLQTIDLATGAGLDETVAAQAAAEGIVGREGDVHALAAAALTAPAVRYAAGRPRWRETYVAALVGDTTLEGYIDLLYRGDDGLVIVDYKTASSGVDLDERTASYRLQGAAYALALESATGKRVARCVFVYLTPGGAHEREIADLPAAIAEVRGLVAGAGS